MLKHLPIAKSPRDRVTDARDLLVILRHQKDPLARRAHGGRSVWIADRIIAHIEARAERAARNAEQEARRIEALPYTGKNLRQHKGMHRTKR